MTRYNSWGEPLPERLTGALGAAWSHEYMTNEGFDGEDGIAYGAQQRLVAAWRENGPATVVFHDWRIGKQATREYAHVRDAYATAIMHGEGAWVRLNKPVASRS